MVSGSHHKTGQDHNAKKHFQELEKYLRKEFDVDKVEYQWSAQHYHSADKVPFIGLLICTSKKVYMATGYFADGLVYGTIAGMLIADLILSKQNQLESIYNSTRLKPIASLAFLLKENSNVFAQYLKKLSSAPKEYKNLKKGEGRVVKIDGEKCAVCRDNNNRVHMVSAVCTHMKCIVNWNNAEQTWDCPCHGSRFKMNGEVIEGPATQNLANYSLVTDEDIQVEEEVLE